MATPDNPTPEVTPGLRPPTTPPPTDLQTGYQPPPNAPDPLQQHHAETARTLAVWLLVILAGTVILHYFCVMVLILLGHAEDTKILEDVFHTLLPVLSGLAGAAGGYYFTKKNG